MAPLHSSLGDRARLFINERKEERERERGRKGKGERKRKRERGLCVDGGALPAGVRGWDVTNPERVSQQGKDVVPA